MTGCTSRDWLLGFGGRGRSGHICCVAPISACPFGSDLADPLLSARPSIRRKWREISDHSSASFDAYTYSMHTHARTHAQTHTSTYTSTHTRARARAYADTDSGVAPRQVLRNPAGLDEALGDVPRVAQVNAAAAAATEECVCCRRRPIRSPRFKYSVETCSSFDV